MTIASTLLTLAVVAPALGAQADASPEPDRPPDPPGFTSAAEADASLPRGVRVHQKGAFDGYTLFAPLNSRTVYLIDLDGALVHTWETDSAPAGGLYLLDDGTLLRCGREDRDPHFRGGGIGGRIQRLAPEGTLLWRYELADTDHQQHHDLEPLPNGNVLAIAWERVSAEEAVARGRDPEQVGQAGLWPDAVYEIRPVPPEGGEIVWEWHVWDHLVQDTDPDLPGYASIPDYPERVDVNADHRDRPPLTPEERARRAEVEAAMAALGYTGGDEGDDDVRGDDDANGARPQAPPNRWDRDGDWLHTNCVSYEPELDLIALSTPHLGEVWILDHSTTTAEARGSQGGRWGHGGDLLWRWGNPRTFGAGTKADQQLFYQHHPTFLRGEEGDLRLLVFNNGRGRPGGDFSSVDELILPFDPEQGFTLRAREPAGPASPVWSYSDPEGFFSAFISGAERLPNGNTLVCSGPPGRLFEVTRAGEIVWDYYNPHGGDVTPPDHAGHAPPLALFRGTRLARDHPGVVALLAD